MRLWSIWDKDALDYLLSNRVMITKPSVSMALDDDPKWGRWPGFERSYDWLAQQMIDRGLIPTYGQRFPLWAWPCEKEAAYRFDDRFAKHHVMLEFEVPDSDVLLTDYDLWHCVLNNWRQDVWPEIFNNNAVPDTEEPGEWVRSPEDVQRITWQATFWQVHDYQLTRIYA